MLVIELSNQRDRERMNEKLKTVQLMNHHVRNAPQSILDSAYVHGHPDEVQSSVARISWALQEILPGETSGEDDNSKHVRDTSGGTQFRKGA